MYLLLWKTNIKKWPLFMAQMGFAIGESFPAIVTVSGKGDIDLILLLPQIFIETNAII